MKYYNLSWISSFIMALKIVYLFSMIDHWIEKHVYPALFRLGWPASANIITFYYICTRVTFFCWLDPFARIRHMQTQKRTSSLLLSVSFSFLVFARHPTMRAFETLEHPCQAHFICLTRRLFNRVTKRDGKPTTVLVTTKPIRSCFFRSFSSALVFPFQFVFAFAIGWWAYDVRMKWKTLKPINRLFNFEWIYFNFDVVCMFY